MPGPDGGDDFVGIGGPCEGFGLLIVLIEEAIDRGLQVGDGAEDAALEPSLGEDREEALDSVEPGSGCRCEMERPSRMAFKPTANIGMLVGGVVVDDGSDVIRDGRSISHRHRLPGSTRSRASSRP